MAKEKLKSEIAYTRRAARVKKLRKMLAVAIETHGSNTRRYRRQNQCEIWTHVLDLENAEAKLMQVIDLLSGDRGEAATTRSVLDELLPMR